jgi:hypothetical protein
MPVESTLRCEGQRVTSKWNGEDLQQALKAWRSVQFLYVYKIQSYQMITDELGEAGSLLCLNTWEMLDLKTLVFFFIHLFICVYIVWVLSPHFLPLFPPTLASRQNLF